MRRFLPALILACLGPSVAAAQQALILIPEEGHGSARRSNQVITAGHVLRFLEENLKGKRQ